MSSFVLLSAGAAFLTFLALPIWRLSPRGGGTEWALGWCALFASGLTLEFSDGIAGLKFFYPAFGATFAGLLYAGARQYCERPVSSGFWVALFAVAALRGALVFVAPRVVTLVGAVLLVLLASTLAAYEIASTRDRRRAGDAELLMVVVLPGLAVISAVYEWSRWVGTGFEFGFFLWLASSCFVAGTQLATIFEQYQAVLEARLEERNEQLRASLVRLEEQQRLVAVGTLAAGIAHQINNPIGAIVAAAQYAQVARDDADAAAIRDDALARVIDEARRCGRIVKSILQFARHEPTPKWIEDLNPTVMRAARITREYAESRGGSLALKISDEPLPVCMSPIDLEQAFVNLIRNAVESRATGVSIEVETLRTSQTACVYVCDDGPGIDPAIRARVVEPFFTTRLAEGGSGLGLSVVHGIVSDHGGRLEIEPRGPQGTRARIELPIAQVDETSA